MSKKHLLLTPIICAFVAVTPLTATAQSASCSLISCTHSEESSVDMEFKASTKGKIVQEISDNEILFEDVKKSTLKELESLFPDKINILLSDGSEEDVEVTWECEKDYENTAYAEYRFNAVFPEGYILKNGIEYAHIIVSIKNEYPTIDQALGCTETVESWLDQHTNDTYYLGTPYEDKYYDEDAAKSPNGDIASGYNAGMNGTGFVAHVLEQCGADLDPIRNTKYNSCTSVTNLSKWVRWFKSMNVQYYFFDSVDDLLSSGELQKGDIILFEPNDWTGSDQYGNQKDNHIGFFWGESSSEDKWWHSARPISGIGEELLCGNQFSKIIPNCADCGIYFFPVQHTEQHTEIQSSGHEVERIYIQNEPSYEEKGQTIRDISVFIKDQDQPREQILEDVETNENPFGENNGDKSVDDQTCENNYLAYGLRNVKKIQAWTQTVKQSESHTREIASDTYTEIAIVVFAVAIVSVLYILSKWELPKGQF